jgi:hypothetical protein
VILPGADETEDGEAEDAEKGEDAEEGEDKDSAETEMLCDSVSNAADEEREPLPRPRSALQNFLQRHCPKLSEKVDPMLSHVPPREHWVSLAISGILFILLWIKIQAFGKDKEAPVDFFVPIPECCNPSWVGHGEFIEDDEGDLHSDPVASQSLRVSFNKLQFQRSMANRPSRTMPLLCVLRQFNATAQQMDAFLGLSTLKLQMESIDWFEGQRMHKSTGQRQHSARGGGS